MKKAALYIRVSTNHQIDKDSLPFQRQELINYSKYALGIENYEIFEDAGYSAKNTIRPAYQDMMSRMRLGEFSHIMVWKIDRISRNLLDFIDMYQELKTYGVSFISKNEQFDTSNAMGEAMLKIILVFAELERQMTSERVTKIMLDRGKKGLWNGAPIPLGYKWVDENKFPIIDEKESPTIKYIYDLYQKTESSYKVTINLNELKFPTKRGGQWTSKTVGDILRNPFYKGTYRYNYKESGRGRKKPEAEWILVDNNHPGIIPVDQWELCNSIMDKNAKKNKSHHRKNPGIHILSGLLECYHCKEGFFSYTDTPRNDGYRPSLYRCKSKEKGTHCKSAMASEVKIGPLLINYISNILKVSKKMSKKAKTISIDEFEKILMSGQYFNEIEGIDPDGLYTLYMSMLYMPGSVLFNNIDVINSKDDTFISELELLEKKKENYIRALSRLSELYLFSEESISKKDYLMKKTEIEENIQNVESKIHDIKINTLTTTESNSEDFINKINNFMLSCELLKDEEINFKMLTMNIDKNLIKTFIKTIIEKIVIKDSRIISINFKNGLVHKFIYKDEKAL